MRQTYGTNIKGDIIAVYDAAGTKLISYDYTAWGITTATYHNSGDITSVIHNPYTYRGYYYDSDLGFYYLQSRYYDANTCRFINADGYVSTGQGLTGYNMFAYCNNNPVMYVDPTGEFPWISVLIIILSVIAGGILGAHYPFEKEAKIDSECNDNLSDETEPSESETISNAERAKYIAIGSMLGLMVGGTIVMLGGVTASAALTPQITKKVLGATAVQIVALGALAYNVGAVLLPMFGIEIDTIDEFPETKK